MEGDFKVERFLSVQLIESVNLRFTGDNNEKKTPSRESFQGVAT